MSDRPPTASGRAPRSDRAPRREGDASASAGAPVGGVRAPAAWFWGLVAAAAVVRLARLGVEGLWVDEAYTAWLADGSFGEMLARLRHHDDAPALYYALVKGVVALFGNSETALRLPSALAGAAAVALAWGFARRHLPGSEILAASATAFSTLLVFYARQARSYALLHPLAILLIWAVCSLRRTPARGPAAAFTAAALALLYAHNLGLLLVLPALPLVAGPLLRPSHRRLGAAVALVLAAGAIPWSLNLLRQLDLHESANQWMAAGWQAGRPLALAPVFSWLAFANGAAPALAPPVSLPGFDGTLRALAWASWGLSALGTGLYLTRLRRPAARATGTAILVFGAVPLLLLVAISAAVGPSYVLGRTDTIALPAFLLMLAAGWGALPRRAALLAAGVWSVLGLLSIQPLWSASHSRGKGADRALAAELGARIGPADAIVFPALARPTIEYYARRQGWWDRVRWAGSFPARLDAAPAATFPAPLDSAGVWQQEALRLRARWEAGGVERVWLLAVRDPRAGLAGPGWPSAPASPPPERAATGAARIGYPQNVLLSALTGLRPVPVEREYRQDWVSGERLLLRVERRAWAPLDSLPAVEVAP